MRVNDVFLELSAVDNKLGIYQELVAHLNSFLETDEEDRPIKDMPQYRSTENMVDLGYIEEEKERLSELMEELSIRRSEILEWKVEVPDEDSD